MRATCAKHGRWRANTATIRASRSLTFFRSRWTCPIERQLTFRTDRRVPVPPSRAQFVEPVMAQLATLGGETHNLKQLGAPIPTTPCRVAASGLTREAGRGAARGVRRS